CNLNRFYETAGFGANDANDEEIFLLSDAIQKADNEQTKINLRRRLAVLAIQGSK
ncbi:HNH endonuclease, partial [Shewanella sp. 11B5]